MKITRSRLRQIIKEEVSRAIHENPLSPGAAVTLANLFEPAAGESMPPGPMSPEMKTRLEGALDSMLDRPPVSEWMNDPSYDARMIFDDFMDLHSEDLETVYERIPKAEAAVEAYLQKKLQDRDKDRKRREREQKGQSSPPPLDTATFG